MRRGHSKEDPGVPREEVAHKNENKGPGKARELAATELQGRNSSRDIKPKYVNWRAIQEVSGDLQGAVTWGRSLTALS